MWTLPLRPLALPAERRSRTRRLFVSGKTVPRWARAVAKPVDKQRNYTTRVIRSVNPGGHAQTRDCTNNVVSIDVGADLTGGCRGLEEDLEGRPEALIEIGR